jgi:ABC-type nickel/cobalt efflux system permease component RcnA
MDQTTTLVIVAAVVLVAGIAIWAWSRSRRSEHLRERFGPEYDHAVEEHGDRTRAESELETRRKRVSRLEIRPLTPDEHQQFSRRWAEIQAQFVDSPERSIHAADALVQDLMRTRGYPVGDFDQRAADISVDHPRVVEHYRSAHGSLIGLSDGDSDTEELRLAIKHYRALVDDLLEQSLDARSAA